MRKTKSILGSVFLWFIPLNHLYALQPNSNIEDTDHGGTDWVITQSTTIAGVHRNLGTFKINPGITVTLEQSTATEEPWKGRIGTVEIYATTITINGTLTGTGMGTPTGGTNRSAGAGYGGGSIGGEGFGVGGGGGAGYGVHGSSGNGYSPGAQIGGAGGNSYGVDELASSPLSSDDIEPGSRGGSGGYHDGYSNGGRGGRGGGAIILDAKLVEIFGNVYADGTNGSYDLLDPSGGGGGGSGGGVLINASTLTISGTLSAKGGDGGNGAGYAGGGGGGGGGRIKIFYGYKNISSISVNGGSGGLGAVAGMPGLSGVIHYDQTPGIPINISPLNNGTTNQPFYDWNNVIDDDGSDNDDNPGDGTIVSYDLQVSTSLSFTPLYISTRGISISFYNSTRSIASSYYWRVRAYDQYSYSDWSSPWLLFADSTPPSGQGIDSVVAYISSCTVNLTVATDVGGSELHVTPYYVDCSSYSNFALKDESASPPVWVTTSSGWQSGTVWQASGLLPDITYYFRVKARDAAMNETVWTSTTSATTLTTRVENLSVALLGPTSFYVSWSAGNNGAGTEYKAQISTESQFSQVNLATTTTVTALTTTFVNLSANTTYHYRVVNKLWESCSWEYVSSVTVTAAYAPALNTFGTVSVNAIEARWGANGNPDGTIYKVECSSDSQFSQVNLATTSLINQATTFINLTSNTTYWFRVKARNYESVETNYTLLGGTATLAATPSSPTVIAGYDDIYGYYFKVVPSYGENHAETEMAIQNISMGGEYLQGDGTRGPAVIWLKKTEWEGGFATNIESVPVGGQVTQSYRVYVRNFGKVVNVSPSASTSCTIPPPKPSAPTVSELNDTSLRMTLSGSVDRAEKYWVYYATWSSASAGQYVCIATVTSPDTTYDDDIDGGNPNVPVVTVSTTTFGQIGVSWSVPSVPSSEARYYRYAGVDGNNRAGQKSEVSVTASSVTPVIARYWVYRKSGTSSDNVFIATATATSYTDTDLAPNTTYQYTIVAISNENKLSSNAVSGDYMTDFGPVTITSREMVDTDNDGNGDSIKLTFNQTILDSSVSAGDFVVVDGATSKAGASVLSGMSGDQANDKILHIYVGNHYSSDKEPAVRYKGSALKAVGGAMLSAEASGVTAGDKVGPAIVKVEAAGTYLITSIKVELSEAVPESDAKDRSNWVIECPAGKTLTLTDAGLVYDSASKTLKFGFSAMSNTSFVRVTGKNLRDSKGNVRAETTKNCSKVMENYYTFDSSAENGGKKPYGRIAEQTSEIKAVLDREMNVSSLQSGMSVRMIYDRLGNCVDSPVSGKVEVNESNRREAKFVPTVPLTKGCLYKVILASSVMDAFNLCPDAEMSWEFKTAADYMSRNVLTPIPGMKVTVNPGTFNEDASVNVVLDAANNAKYADKTKLRRAIELEKGRAEGNSPGHYPISTLMFEIVGETPNGSVIQGTLGNKVTLTMNYTDNNNDGIVDSADGAGNTNPPVEAKDLEYYWLNETAGEFEKVVGTTVNRDEKTVTASVEHFSVYAVMGALNTSGSSSQLRIYPTVWTPNKRPEPITFDNLPEPCEIKIYGVTRQAYATLHSDGSGKIKWYGKNDDGENLAAGTYVAVMISSGEKRKGKFIIMR